MAAAGTPAGLGALGSAAVPQRHTSTQGPGPPAAASGGGAGGAAGGAVYIAPLRSNLQPTPPAGSAVAATTRAPIVPRGSISRSLTIPATREHLSSVASPGASSLHSPPAMAAGPAPVSLTTTPPPATSPVGPVTPKPVASRITASPVGSTTLTHTAQPLTQCTAPHTRAPAPRAGSNPSAMPTGLPRNSASISSSVGMPPAPLRGTHTAPQAHSTGSHLQGAPQPPAGRPAGVLTRAPGAPGLARRQPTGTTAAVPGHSAIAALLRHPAPTPTAAHAARASTLAASGEVSGTTVPSSPQLTARPLSSRLTPAAAHLTSAANAHHHSSSSSHATNTGSAPGGLGSGRDGLLPAGAVIRMSTNMSAALPAGSAGGSLRGPPRAALVPTPLSPHSPRSSSSTPAPAQTHTASPLASECVTSSTATGSVAAAAQAQALRTSISSASAAGALGSGGWRQGGVQAGQFPPAPLAPSLSDYSETPTQYPAHRLRPVSSTAGTHMTLAAPPAADPRLMYGAAGLSHGGPSPAEVRAMVWPGNVTAAGSQTLLPNSSALSAAQLSGSTSSSSSSRSGLGSRPTSAVGLSASTDSATPSSRGPLTGGGWGPRQANTATSATFSRPAHIQLELVGEDQDWVYDAARPVAPSGATHMLSPGYRTNRSTSQGAPSPLVTSAPATPMVAAPAVLMPGPGRAHAPATSSTSSSLTSPGAVSASASGVMLPGSSAYQERFRNTLAARDAERSRLMGELRRTQEELLRQAEDLQLAMAISASLNEGATQAEGMPVSPGLDRGAAAVATAVVAATRDALAYNTQQAARTSTATHTPSYHHPAHTPPIRSNPPVPISHSTVRRPGSTTAAAPTPSQAPSAIVSRPAAAQDNSRGPVDVQVTSSTAGGGGLRSNPLYAHHAVAAHTHMAPPAPLTLGLQPAHSLNSNTHSMGANGATGTDSVAQHTYSGSLMGAGPHTANSHTGGNVTIASNSTSSSRALQAAMQQAGAAPFSSRTAVITAAVPSGGVTSLSSLRPTNGVRDGAALTEPGRRMIPITGIPDSSDDEGYDPVSDSGSGEDAYLYSGLGGLRDQQDLTAPWRTAGSSHGASSSVSAGTSRSEVGSGSETQLAQQRDPGGWSLGGQLLSSLLGTEAAAGVDAREGRGRLPSSLALLSQALFGRPSQPITGNPYHHGHDYDDGADEDDGSVPDTFSQLLASLQMAHHHRVAPGPEPVRGPSAVSQTGDRYPPQAHASGAAPRRGALLIRTAGPDGQGGGWYIGVQGPHGQLSAMRLAGDELGGMFGFGDFADLEGLTYERLTQLEDVKVPTPKEVLEQLPTSFFRGSAGAAAKGAVATVQGAGLVYDGPCSICMEEWAEGDELMHLPCRHAFHAACVKQWLGTYSKLCPVCKSALA